MVLFYKELLRSAKRHERQATRSWLAYPDAGWGIAELMEADVWGSRNLTAIQTDGTEGENEHTDVLPVV